MSTETSTSETIMVRKDKATLFLMVLLGGDSSVYHCAFFSIERDVLVVARINCDPGVFSDDIHWELVKSKFNMAA